MKKTIGQTAMALAALAGLTACSGEGATGPSAESTWDLTVELEVINVLGDCESTPGNPGEFVWKMTVQLPLRASDTTNDNYPNRGGGLPYHDGDRINLADTNVRLTGLRQDQISDVVLVFQVTEWDPSGADPDMNDRAATAPVPLNHSGKRQIAGLGAGHCGLRFEYRPNWVAR